MKKVITAKLNGFAAVILDAGVCTEEMVDFWAERIEALLPQWVSVQKELPETQDDFIVFEGKRRTVATYDPSDKTWWESDGNCLVSVFPTHWMKFPKEGGEYDR